jgi:hypothetical protein
MGDPHSVVPNFYIIMSVPLGKYMSKLWKGALGIQTNNNVLRKKDTKKNNFN